MPSWFGKSLPGRSSRRDDWMQTPSSSSNERSFGLWADRDPGVVRPHVPYRPRGPDFSQPECYAGPSARFRTPEDAFSPQHYPVPSREQYAAPRYHEPATSSRHHGPTASSRYQEPVASSRHYDAPAPSRHQSTRSTRRQAQQEQYSDYRSVSPLGTSQFEQPLSGPWERVRDGTTRCRPQEGVAVPALGQDGYYGSSSATRDAARGMYSDFRRGDIGGWDHF